MNFRQYLKELPYIDAGNDNIIDIEIEKYGDPYSDFDLRGFILNMIKIFGGKKLINKHGEVQLHDTKERILFAKNLFRDLTFVTDFGVASVQHLKQYISQKYNLTIEKTNNTVSEKIDSHIQTLFDNFYSKEEDHFDLDSFLKELDHMLSEKEHEFTEEEKLLFVQRLFTNPFKHRFAELCVSAFREYIYKYLKGAKEDLNRFISTEDPIVVDNFLISNYEKYLKD